MKFDLPPNPFSDEERAKHDEIHAAEASDNFILNEAMQIPVHLHLEAFRKKQKYKKTEMAKMMGVTVRSYYGYESGARAIPSSALVGLHAFTGCDINDVLLGDRRDEDAENATFQVTETLRIFLYLCNEEREMSRAMKLKVTAEVLRKLAPRSPFQPEDLKKAILTVSSQQRQEYVEEPSPQPFWDDYDGDTKSYQKDMAAWKKHAEEPVSDA